MTKLIGPILLLLFSLQSARGQRDCALKKDVDSIKVYTCAAENLKFKTIKATFMIHAELSQVVAYVLDIENYVHWQYNTIEAQIVKRISDREIIYYTQIAAPWPVSNRDMVTGLVVSQDPSTRIVTISTKSVPGLIAAKEGIVRVPTSQAKWTIVPISTSQLKVDYVIQIDPGGFVPAWMINMVAAQAPYESFRNLKEKIHNPPLKNIETPFITDH